MIPEHMLTLLQMLRASSAALADDSVDAWHRQPHDSSSTGTVCLLTMANAYAASRYPHSLASQRCYAARHKMPRFEADPTHWIIEPPWNYDYDERTNHSTPFTYKKLAVVWAALQNRSCDWVWWLDADVFIVDQHRPPDAWLKLGAQLVLTDHHAVHNNGGFFLRNSHRVRTVFMRHWLEATKAPPYPPGYAFTDNGSFMEAVLSAFVPGYPRYNCSTKWILACALKVFDDAFGPAMPGQLARGGASGVALVYPQDGFNNHGCGERDGRGPQDCSHWGKWNLNVPSGGHGANGWHLDDMYSPLAVTNAQHKPPMFGWHSKVHDLARSGSAGADLERRATHPTDLDCTKWPSVELKWPRCADRTAWDCARD